ncbi:hypothetical protein BCL69_107714 [Nitrosomonas communis]|uniref:Uncharacterized protein n=1 Tax=Nitrosomonas communis TaxID=44574 RepID=A0A5D3YA65_9PROT|nr:hypothetical protein BCL69_107714 [Nitrosomonas communis]
MSFWERFRFWRERKLSVLESIRRARNINSILYYEFYDFMHRGS